MQSRAGRPLLGQGYCAATDAPGDCGDRTSGLHTATVSGYWKASRYQIRSLRDCKRKCLSDCPACAYVSFSKRNNDCSWYSFCPTPLQKAHGGKSYTTAQVRNRSLASKRILTVTAADAADSTAVAARFPARPWDGRGSPPSDAPTDECGDAAVFSPVQEGASSKAGAQLPTLEVADGTVYRTRRPEMLARVRDGVRQIARAGSFRRNSYCKVFGSCAYAPTQRISLHSEVYFACPARHQAVLASSMLSGASRTFLPGHLGPTGEGDANVFCLLAETVRRIVEEIILPRHELPGSRCTVQETFVNVQKTGSFTNPHVHPDDFYGAIFYLDAPDATRFCYDASESTAQKDLWREHAPQLTSGNISGGRGYVAAGPGDIVFAPIGWLRHWVPPVLASGAVRTAVVLNMICIPGDVTGQQSPQRPPTRAMPGRVGSLGLPRPRSTEVPRSQYGSWGAWE